MQKQKTAPELVKLHKEFHSTPDLNWEQENADLMTCSWTEGESAVDDIPSSEDWRKSQSEDDVYGYEMKVINQRNSRHSWAFANKEPKNANNVRYHGSWQSIEQVYGHSDRPEHVDEDEETEEEDEDEDATTPVVDQLALLGHGDYRAVKPCRPIYSSGNNTLTKGAALHAPPPDHPPPPPPSQVVRVDVTKSHSEYAFVTGASSETPSTPVMSSFRPSDNAKLYALPEDAKNTAFMTLRPATAKPVATSTPTRTHSLPLRSIRPNVSVKSAAVARSVELKGEGAQSTPPIPDPDYDEDDHARALYSGNVMNNAKRQVSLNEFSVISTRRSQDRQSNDDLDEEFDKVSIDVRHAGMAKSQSFCADILKAKSLLKTSQSFPEELSDSTPCCESDGLYVTFVPVNNDSKPGQDHNTKERNNGRRTCTLTRHAVSLIQLPPPAENGEGDTESEANARTQMNESAEQDSVSTISTLSSLSTSSSDRDATILENKPNTIKQKETHKAVREEAYKENSPSPSMIENERTIEESLQLIRMHVNSLTESFNKSPAPVVPPPPEFSESSGSSRESTVAPEDIAFLPPPPPEFCDSKMQPSLRALPKSCSVGHLRSSLESRSPSAVSQLFGDNRRMVERRLSDDSLTGSKPSTVRVVGAVPKKVSFSPDVIDSETKEVRAMNFRNKPLPEWTTQDTADWLDSLFLNEHKSAFIKKGIDGQKLLRLSNEMLTNLGVKRIGHRLNIEKSLKRLTNAIACLE